MNTMSYALNRATWESRGVPFSTDYLTAARAIVAADVCTLDAPRPRDGAMVLNIDGRLLALASSAWHRLLGRGLFHTQSDGSGRTIVAMTVDEEACTRALDVLESLQGKGGPARRKILGLPKKPTTRHH